MATLTSLPPSVVRKYQTRVDRGAALLDEKLPGWWRHIKLTRLNMAEGVINPRYGECGCVGAQVAYAYKAIRDGDTGFFSDTMSFLFGSRYTHQNNVGYGFVVGSPECRKDQDREAYRLLDDLWADKVRERRNR